MQIRYKTEIVLMKHQIKFRNNSFWFHFSREMSIHLSKHPPG